MTTKNHLRHQRGFATASRWYFLFYFFILFYFIFYYGASMKPPRCPHGAATKPAARVTLLAAFLRLCGDKKETTTRPPWLRTEAAAAPHDRYRYRLLLLSTP